MDKAELKQQAGECAADRLDSGMVVGLGHGSTAIWALRSIARRIKQGDLKRVVGIPCSRAVEADARSLGIPLTTLNEHAVVDITIDGADEVSPSLDLIKGGGGALLREKVVAQASRCELIVVDESKLSDCLGCRWPVPVEVVPFALRVETEQLERMGAKTKARRDSEGELFVTDQGNHIVDCTFGEIGDPGKLAAQLAARAGVVEHGLFIGLADEIIVAGSSGLRQLRRKGARGG